MTALQRWDPGTLPSRHQAPRSPGRVDGDYLGEKPTAPSLRELDSYTRSVPEWLVVHVIKEDSLGDTNKPEFFIKWAESVPESPENYKIEQEAGTF